MIIHVILDPEQMQVVFMSPSNEAYGEFIAELRREMVEDDIIEEDADLDSNDILEMYGNWYYDVYSTLGIDGWDEHFKEVE